MQSSPEQIKLFSLFIKLLGAKRAIEVSLRPPSGCHSSSPFFLSCFASPRGPFLTSSPPRPLALSLLQIGVFTGYSALGIAQALPDDGVLYAFERDAEMLQVAKGFWREAGVSHKVVPVEGDAAEKLQAMVDGADMGAGVDQDPQAPFDFAFIDANKRAQRGYFEQCLRLVRPGGLIVVDNVLWYGRVVDGERNDKITQSIRELNSFLSGDSRIDLTVLPVGDGIALCYKL